MTTCTRGDPLEANDPLPNAPCSSLRTPPPCDRRPALRLRSCLYALQQDLQLQAASPTVLQPERSPRHQLGRWRVTLLPLRLLPAQVRLQLLRRRNGRDAVVGRARAELQQIGAAEGVQDSFMLYFDERKVLAQSSAPLQCALTVILLALLVVNCYSELMAHCWARRAL
eukprot:748580-Hanusia_phi.AAC.1